MTFKNKHFISNSAHISIPYLWFITLSTWGMFTHENSVRFKYQHYEYRHISRQQIINPIFPTGNNQETMSHKDIVFYQSPKKSLHVKDWSWLDNMFISGPFCHIPVLIMRIYASRVLFSSSSSLICAMGVCVGPCASLTGVTGITGITWLRE